MRWRPGITLPSVPMKFSTITYQQLKELTDITEVVDDEAFAAWRDRGEAPSEPVSDRLRQLVEWHRIHLESYTEEEIKMKLIGPLVELVNYREAGLTEWYERAIAATIGGEELSGKADFILARGEKEPVPPFFMLQEFKPEFSNANPEVQLIAEMLVSAKLGQQSIVRGSYTNAGIFRFVELRQPAGESPVYCVSRHYSAVHLPDLMDMFRFFSAIKGDL